MKKLTAVLIFTLFSNAILAQEVKLDDKIEIQKVLNTFMECLVKKDSLKFNSLFHKEPVAWVGVMQQKSFENQLKRDSKSEDNFSSTYKKFYQSFYNKDVEENFFNVIISTDGYIASVIFDYNFFYKKTKLNWGKEIWAMIKTNGEWKIASVLFSIEYDKITPEPQR
jgi:hypothetical protein